MLLFISIKLLNIASHPQAREREAITSKIEVFRILNAFSKVILFELS